jgi:hypothetical protein
MTDTLIGFRGHAIWFSAACFLHCMAGYSTKWSVIMHQFHRPWILAVLEPNGFPSHRHFERKRQYCLLLLARRSRVVNNHVLYPGGPGRHFRPGDQVFKLCFPVIFTYFFFLHRSVCIVKETNIASFVTFPNHFSSHKVLVHTHNVVQKVSLNDNHTFVMFERMWHRLHLQSTKYVGKT